MEIKRDGFVFTVRTEQDYDPDLSYLTQDYTGVGDLVERAHYSNDDEQRLSDYHKGYWWMQTMSVDCTIKTAVNWAVPHTVGRASLSGIESDTAPEYLEQIQELLIQEAKHDAVKTWEALSEALWGQEFANAARSQVAGRSVQKDS
jgi:hypothetical protein